MVKIAVTLFALFLFVGCQSDGPVDLATAVPTPRPTSIPASTHTAQAVPTEISPTDLTAVPTSATVAKSDDQSTAAPTIEIETPVDPLIAAFPGTSQTNGAAVVVTGQVLDVDGSPLPGVAVEIWQTDVNGRYDHPGDSTSSQRDMSFQFFGTSITDENGIYQLRTIIPGAYGNRPPHIHFKVKQNGNELLTSQFYFVEDISIVENEGLFTQAGENGSMLLLQAVPGPSPEFSVAVKDIIVDSGSKSGTLTLTPAQGEGPYYPVVDVSAYDNDLVLLP